jgi:hypothetical protein
MTLKEFRVYTPWDSIIVEAKDEADAKRKAIQQILSEISYTDCNNLDAEERNPNELK